MQSRRRSSGVSKLANASQATLVEPKAPAPVVESAEAKAGAEQKKTAEEKEEKKEEEKKEDKPEEKEEEKKEEQKEGEKKEEKVEEKKDEGKKEEKKEGDDFSEAQDKQLKELKEQNRPWKEIAKEMGLKSHAIGKLKARYKELSKPADEAAAVVSAPDAGGAVPEKKEQNSDEKDKNGQKPETNAETAAAPAQEGGDKKVNVEPEPDNLFDTEDLQALRKILSEDEEQLWLRIASRYFDRTGQRIHPDDIQAKLAK